LRQARYKPGRWSETKVEIDIINVTFLLLESLVVLGVELGFERVFFDVYSDWRKDGRR
jgi:hypothetical protein